MEMTSDKRLHTDGLLVTLVTLLINMHLSVCDKFTSNIDTFSLNLTGQYVVQLRISKWTDCLYPFSIVVCGMWLNIMRRSL